MPSIPIYVSRGIATARQVRVDMGVPLDAGVPVLASDVAERPPKTIQLSLVDHRHLSVLSAREVVG
jgi:hypothetical protein